MAIDCHSSSSARHVLLLGLCLLLVGGVAQAQSMEFELVPESSDAGSIDPTMMPSMDAAGEAPHQCAPPVSVEEACRGASDTHAGVDYEHCMASLGADPRSKEAGSKNMHGLAVLATKMAIDHAASTEAKIDDLAELEPEEAPRRARFDHCLELYGGAADLLRDALDNLKAKVYGKAMEQLTAAMGASESCEDAWQGEEELHRVPVAAHDREYGRMAHIAFGFTHATAAAA